jgi:hypothetical protein
MNSRERLSPAFIKSRHGSRTRTVCHWILSALALQCLVSNSSLAQTVARHARVHQQIGAAAIHKDEEARNLARIMDLPIPDMVYPPNGMVTAEIVPQFIISSVVGADRYELQVATDEFFSGFSILSYSYWQFSEADTELYEIEWFPGIVSTEDLLNSSVYYWRVRALNTSTGEQSDWAEPSRYMTVASGASIPQPSLDSPSPNATVPWLNIELEWDRVTNATWYEIQWSTDYTFSGFNYYWTRGESPSLGIDVKPMMTYYWRVVALNDNSISAFSTAGSFQTGDHQTLTDAIGTFDDGSGLDDYQNNLDIYWLIKPTNAFGITLSFTSFDTESDYDYLTIHDGETTSSPVIGRFSGASIPPPVSSSGGAMLVQFTTDPAVAGRGWTAKYESLWNPSPKDISEYAEELSSKYKVPSVIIKAIVEQESVDWDQARSTEVSPDGGIGLMQLTPASMDGFPNNVELGIIENGPQDATNPYLNPFTTKTEQNAVDLERLRTDWKYNLEIGVRWLLTKKVKSGGAGDDASILENWYYPLAYYNGATKYTGQPEYLINGKEKNDPSFSYPRSVADPNTDWKNPAKFPYQECVFNIIAQKHLIPKERKVYFGPPIMVTLPGPDKVSLEPGEYSYVVPDFCFFDWALYWRNGTVWIGNATGKNNGCRPDYNPYSGVVHTVPFGPPGISITRTVSTVGLIDFSPAGNETAVAIDFKSVSGSGVCTVNLLASSPTNIGFAGGAPTNISEYRWVVSQTGLASFVAEVGFDLSQLPLGISNPSTVTVFNRTTPGIGLFTALPTTYDGASNTLWVTVSGFSEFIFGSNDNPLTAVTENGLLPNTFYLYQNYPNPFNPSTTIEFALPKSAFVTLQVYDLLGSQVAELVNEKLSAGTYTRQWDARGLASGVYFYRLSAGGFSQTKKLILVR